MAKLKLAVIFGGKSSEYSVSLHSAGSLIQSLHKDLYDLLLIGISKDGAWYAYNGDVEHIEHDEWLNSEYVTPCLISPSTINKGVMLLHDDGSYELKAIDCIFPVLHGKNGEDGTIQGLFELSGIPYVGCDVLASAICMDKEMAHIVLDNANIPCAPYMCVYEDKQLDYDKLYEEAKNKLGLPMFIKPANAGSSYGVHKVEALEEFKAGMIDAFYHDGRGKIIIETAIDGFEIGCAVMGNQEIVAGSVDEIETSAPFFDFNGKYQMVDTKIHCPARISKEQFELARNIAINSYKALNCKGMSRVDMFVKTDGSIVVNEVNTIPGFTSTSRYPSMMKDYGIEFPDLLDQLIAYAMNR